jgi:hypothetical protein
MSSPVLTGKMSLCRIGFRWFQHQYNPGPLRIWSTPELFRSLSGGGEQGDLGERSAHPKPPRDLKTSETTRTDSRRRHYAHSLSLMMKDNPMTFLRGEGSARKEEKEGWILDVYRRQTGGSDIMDGEEELLEFDLAEEVEITTSCVAIVVFYSCKSGILFM